MTGVLAVPALWPTFAIADASCLSDSIPSAFSVFKIPTINMYSNDRCCSCVSLIVPIKTTPIPGHYMTAVRFIDPVRIYTYEARSFIERAGFGFI